MKRLDSLFLLMILIGTNCLAQTPFRYKRNISGVHKEGWYDLPLPSGVYKDLNRDLTDFRLYSVSGHDTLELPFLLDIRKDEMRRETVHLPLFNESYRDGVLYLMFELKGSQKVNHLDLDFDEADYFGFVTLEGSEERQAWFEIAKDQRIVSIKKGTDDYTLSTLTFPVTDYRFLRVRVKSDTRLTFREASFAYEVTEPGAYSDIPLQWSMDSDKKNRQSFVEVRLHDHVPVNSIRVQADSTLDFYRSFRLEYVRDSARTEKGWIKQYSTLYEGHLTSYTPNFFKFPWKLAKEIRLVIHDRDNSPLTIQRISATGPDVRVISYLKPGNNLVLYGADGVRPAAYDLAYFEDKIPDALLGAHFGPAKEILAMETETKPLFENKIWLWSIMGLMIGGLGFFTLKMMKPKA